MPTHRYVWLHGFASSPESSKARFAQGRFRERGAELLVPDLNEPEFRSLTVTRMLEQLDAIADAPLPDGSLPKLVLCGSSLGGFTAATWAASRADRTHALVLLAPAFDLAARWEASMKPDALAQWRRDGDYPLEHYAHGRKERLSIGFLDDARTHAPFPLSGAPTLVLQGTRDEVVAPELAREFTRRMQTAHNRIKLVELDDGHELNKDLARLWTEIEKHLDEAVCF